MQPNYDLWQARQYVTLEKVRKVQLLTACPRASAYVARICNSIRWEFFKSHLRFRNGITNAHALGELGESEKMRYFNT